MLLCSTLLATGCTTVSIDANSSADDTKTTTESYTQTTESNLSVSSNANTEVSRNESTEIKTSGDTLQASKPTNPVCFVNDPNDTYANLRTSPNGELIGPIQNGTTIQIANLVPDTKGRSWAGVNIPDGRFGYIFRALITCN